MVRAYQLVISGPGGFLIFNQLMLWSSVSIFAITVQKYFGRQHWISWLFLLIPLVPPILRNSTMIWKDISMGYVFLLIAAIFTKVTLDKNRLRLPSIIFVLLLIFYTIGIKYQASYIAPWVCVWFVWIQSNFKLKLRFYGYALLISLSLIYAESMFESTYYDYALFYFF